MWELPAENGGKPWLRDVWYCPLHELKTGDEVDLTSENINKCVTLGENKQDDRQRRKAYVGGTRTLEIGRRRPLAGHTDIPSYVWRLANEANDDQDNELPSRPGTPP